MTNRFMISVAAAALIAGTGFANAQGTGMSRESPSAGSTAQQSAPSSDRSGGSSAPINRDATEQTSPSSGMKATQSEQQKSSAGGKNQRVEDNAQGQKSKSMSSENDNAKGAKDMKAEGRDRGGSNMNAEGRDRGGNMNAEQRGAAEGRSQTTGQAGASAKLSSEQRTRITSVIREQHVEPVRDVNFQIQVGVRVPRTVSFRPLPPEVVSVYPEWRGYEFVLVNDKIVVVNPRTLEIVDVLDA